MLHHLGLDLVGKLAADQRRRHLAVAEAGNAGMLLEARNGALPLAGNVFGGNLDGDFALAGVLGYFGG